MRPRVFPAEDSGRWPASPTCPCRFNEAAGIPRGRRLHPAEPAGGDLASMRPRVFPAEDRRFEGSEVGAVDPASMRPRVFPAEDVER